MKEKVLVIIPARSGSKGIPDKNIKMIGGKPLLIHSVDTAKELAPDKIVVSTDSQEYAKIVNEWCGEGYVSFLRPKELATDTSPSSEFILHALSELKKQGETYELLILLEPTHPIRKAWQIKEAIKHLKQSGFSSLVSVYKNDQCHPVLAFKKGFNNTLIPFGAYPNHPARQSLEPAYFLEGSFYISYVDTYKQRKSFTHNLTIMYEIDREYAIEIDEPCDIDLVEYQMNKSKCMGVRGLILIPKREPS